MTYWINSKARSRGVAAVEMVLVVPILLILGLGVVEITHAFLANNITVALSREGASLASRSIAIDEQDIMDALAFSATPLDFYDDGVIYISVVVGEEDLDPYLAEQHKWINYGFESSSRVWSECPRWGIQGNCIIPAVKPRLENFKMLLEPGETVHIVEVMYDYQLLTQYIFEDNFLIYSDTFM